MENKTCIRDIYLGRLDAKDEVVVEGIDQFVESFVLPENINIDAVFNNSQCFVSGYKGTGKTAMLYYLEDYFLKKDARTVSTFIPFKEDYSEAKRVNMKNLAQRIVSRLSINSEAQKNDEDFEYIWALELFKIIIDANGQNRGKLFVPDEHWKNFKQKIKLVEKDSNIKKFVLVPSITYETTTQNLPSVTASLNTEESIRQEAYHKFITLIDDAFIQLKLITRTDIPFFIFIDELEAYYGDEVIFKRDLKMIRDLIFTAKRINMIFWKNRKFNTKIMCAFRTEVMNAINRFVIPKEINKAIGGFEIALRWNYSNTTSIEHPIMRILLRRIQMAEAKTGSILSELQIFNKWFPKRYSGEESVCFILNRTWNKPRDIVRFLMTAQECIKQTANEFSQTVMDSIIKMYAIASLIELKEEMRALYTSEETDSVIQCFKGFRTTFTKSELEYHIAKNQQLGLLVNKLDSILRDLYRLGMIGNYSNLSDSHHWQHKADEGPLFTDEWQLQIHCALWGALQISLRHDYAVKAALENNKMYAGKIVDIVVERVEATYAGVTFEIDETEFYGIILKGGVAQQFVENITDYLQVGYATTARIEKFDTVHGNWLLTKNFADT